MFLITHHLLAKDLLLFQFYQKLGFVMGVADGIIAGGAAGVVVEAALYPIDTIKTRLQACSVWSIWLRYVLDYIWAVF